MEERFVVKKFYELTNDELFEIYKLRAEVFVRDQNCPYVDIDNADKKAYHIFLPDEKGIKAYLRMMEKDEEFDMTRIGRVIAREKRTGIGAKLMKFSLDFARNVLKTDSVKVEAQTYAKKFYEKQNFVQTSEEFLEDNIPHVEMICRFNG